MTLMSEADRKRFLDTLRRDDEFRTAVRRELLTEELLNLPQTVAGLAGDLQQLTTDLQQLTSTITVLVDAVAQQRQDFTALTVDVRNYMERTISLIGDGFTASRGEISELRTDVATGFAVVDAKFDQVNAEIRGIKNQLAS